MPSKHLIRELTNQYIMNELTPTINEQSQDTPNFAELSCEQLVEYLRQIVANQDISTIKEQMDAIKVHFYKKMSAESLLNTASNDAQTDATEIEEIKSENTEAPTAIDDKMSSIEREYKSIMAEFKQKRTEYKAKLEKEQQENYDKKKEIIKKINDLISSTEDISTTLPLFRNLQNEWKSIGQVPQTVVNDLWKEYNYTQEQFYDLIKINAALRELDFKKNLDAKQSLINQAIELQNESDIIKAFKELQKLHDEWREIGPVAREIRESLWAEFKSVSTIINKKHQAYFEQLKEAEEALTKEFENICTEIEAIKLDELKTYKEWENEATKIIEQNSKFHAQTPSEHRVINKIYPRYRTACNRFFEAKNEYYKKLKEELQANYEQKRKLVEKAEQLKNSQAWKATTEQLIALQKEWKKIGPVQKKYSDAIWQRFTSACDHFFAQKEENFKSQKNEEQENLTQKLEVIEEIRNYQLSGNDEEDFSNLKNLSDKFLAIGHVPYKEKDKVYKTFREVSDEKFSPIRTKRRMSQLSLSGDKNKLIRQYENLKQQIATYENNIGFFSKNSKQQNALVKDLEHKIANLKQDLNIITEQLNKLNTND